ncbi:MFS transporter [Nocardia sp. NPDC004123]
MHGVIDGLDHAIWPASLMTSSPASAASADLDVPGSPRRWRQLALLSGLISMDNSEAAVVSTLFPAIRTALGLPLSALGVLVAISKIVTMIFGPVWVLVAQRFGRKTILVTTCGLWGLWSCAAGLAQNFTQLLVLYTIAAIGFAAGGPLVNGMLADLFGDSHRGRAAGLLYGGAAVLGALVAPALGQLSRVDDGWRYGFFAAGAITVAAGLLVWRFFEDPRIGATDGPAIPETRLGLSHARQLLAGRTLRLILVQRLFNTQLAFMSFGVVFLVSTRGFSNADAALIAPFSMLSYLLGTVLGGFLGDYFQRVLPRTGRLGLWQSAVALWAAAAALGTQVPWHELWIYGAIFTVVGLTQGFIPGCNRPILIAVTAPELCSAAFSLMIAAESAGWAISTLIIGYLGDRIGLQATLLYVVVAVTFVNALFMFVMYRPYIQESEAVHRHSNEFATDPPAPQPCDAVAHEDPGIADVPSR